VVESVMVDNFLRLCSLNSTQQTHLIDS